MEEGNEVQLSELGKALGRFHEAGHNFIPRHDKLGPRGETDPELLCRQIEEIERSAPDCADALKRYGGWLESASEALPDNLYSSLPHTLVHGDVQPANVLFDGNRFAAWLDLDWVARRPRIYDLAFAILFCCAERETPIQSDDIRSLTQPYAWRPDREERFMVGYEGVAGALTEGERECLGSQVKLSWCHARIAGALKVEAGKRREFLERRPVEVSFFEKHPAQRSVD